MIEQHRIHSHQVVTCLFSKTQRVTADTEQLAIEREASTAPRSRRSSDLNWETFAVWSYAVLLFATLLFCVYIILAKCNGDWPFRSDRNDGKQDERGKPSQLTEIPSPFYLRSLPFLLPAAESRAGGTQTPCTWYE